MRSDRPLDPWAQYEVDDIGLIRPVHSMGWTKEPWKNAESPEAALAEIARSPVLMEDIFQTSGWEGVTPDEWKEMRAKMYLDIEDGFYLATGVNVGYGTFRFEWHDEVFFNIRPDFGFLSIASDLGECPINAVESAVRNRLVDYYQALDSIKSAIDVGEIEAPALYMLDWWLDFWKVREIAVPGRAEAKKKTELKSERQDRLRERIKEEKAKGNKAFLATVASEEGVSPTRIKQLVADSDTSADSVGMWTGLSTASRVAVSKKKKTKA